MDFNLKVGLPEKQSTACLILPVANGDVLSSAGQHLDRVSGGYISKQLRRAQHNGEQGRILLLPEVPNIAAEQVLLLGCGLENSVSDLQFVNLITKLAKALQENGIKNAISYMTNPIAKDRPLTWHLGVTIRHLIAANYRFNPYKSQPEKTTLTQFSFGLFDTADKTDKTTHRLAKAAIAQGQVTGHAMNFVKDLGNLPPNICTPSYLAKEAQRLAKTYSSIKTTVLDAAAAKRLKMGSFLAVAQGSDEPPRFIILEYHGGKKQAAPIVLVGKGITFDTGGLALKPLANMVDMKYDMLGAATVLATLQAAAQLKLPIHLIGIIPTAENMISGRSCRPNDILTSMSGQTIEVLNPDAEGRLILCDALTYCERFKPAYVIDIATLTGAIIVSLGLHTTGLFSNDDELARQLEQASQESYDTVWRMPITEEYQEQLKSPFADIANIGGPMGSSITAACFLSRFTKNYRWAHLDIAGTSMRSGSERCATGRPVPLLLQFLINYATS